MTTIIQGTPKTDVYLNELCGICIKQENEFFEESPFVYFTIEEAEKIIKAILETKKEAEKIIDNENGEKYDKE